MTLSPFKLALAAASMAAAAPAVATCPTSGCGQQPPVNDPGQIIVSGTVNNNSTIGIRNDIANTNTSTAYGGQGIGYGGQAHANIGDVRASVGDVTGGTSSATVGNVTGGNATVGNVAGGSLNLAAGAIAPVANGGMGGQGGQGGAGGSVGNTTSSSVSQGGSVSGLSTGNQSVNINTPRPAFAPTVSAFAAGNCGWGASFSFGAPGLGLGPAFAGQSAKCHNRETARQLLQTGVASNNADLAATGFARLAEGDKKLVKAYENRGQFVGMFAPAAAPVQAEPAVTYVVPPTPVVPAPAAAAQPVVIYNVMPEQTRGGSAPRRARATTPVTAPVAEACNGARLTAQRICTTVPRP